MWFGKPSSCLFLISTIMDYTVVVTSGMSDGYNRGTLVRDLDTRCARSDMRVQSSRVRNYGHRASYSDSVDGAKSGEIRDLMAAA